jgi:hypothetical protein
LFEVPIVLLVLCNRKRGPSFLRAVLSVLYENSDRAAPQILIHDAVNDSKWGRFRYDNPDDRPDDEKNWYNLLTKTDQNINDLIHWWRQFCLNYEILEEDLQRLSKDYTVDELQSREGAHLNEFKINYPVLFDCLYSVFGTMLSNSRLCEQIHGMMRHGLRTQVGMEQADAQRIYNSGTDHEMKEERRNMSQLASEHRGKHKKAAKHSQTKNQQVRLSEQLVEKAGAHAEMELATCDDNIPSVSTTSKRGRRVMDQTNLDNQMMEEDEKAGRLRRKQLTPELAKEMAEKTTLTNDATYVANAALVLWHSRVPKLLVKKFWDVPAAEMKETLQVAKETFVHLIIDDVNAIKTKKEGSMLIKNHIDFVNESGRKILQFVKDMGGFDYKSVHKSDVFSFFVRPVERAFGDEVVMEPVEEALVRTCTAVDPHYIYVTDGRNKNEDEIDGVCIDGNDSNDEFV